jgi:hypothetical protein
VVPLVLFTLARTHHHWYLDPSYPAWAMLAALAVLDLVRRARPARRTAVLAACILVPLTLCETRILYRVLLAERMPEAQRVLASLAAHRLELGHHLRTTPLRHSERFILEAMGGFQVEETTVAAAAAERNSAADPLADLPVKPSVLIAKGTPGPRPQPSLGSGIFLNTRDYLLYQSASQIAGRSAPARRSGHARWARRPPGRRLGTARSRNRVLPT